MKYRTIVADPPWHYDPLPVGRPPKGVIHDGRTTPLPFPSMTIEEIAALPVRDLAEPDAHLYLWTTNRYLQPAFGVLHAWGFRYSQTLAWCKKPMGLGPGATFANTIEFVLVGKRGNLSPLRRWDTAWLQLPRTTVHSKKPEAFLDIVEQVSPGPRLEMFARRDRLGWDTWGDPALRNRGARMDDIDQTAERREPWNGRTGGCAMNETVRDWWTGPEGQAFEQQLLEVMDEDDAMTVIVWIQDRFVPRAARLAFDEDDHG